LLSGPFFSPSTESFSLDHEGVAGALVQSLLGTSANPSAMPKSMPVHQRPRPPAVDPPPPSVSCQPLGPGCEVIHLSSGGAVGVKGLNAVDSATAPTNVLGEDIEPADQGLCAGNGYVIEDNNVGEILIFNTALKRVSAVIPLDTLMGLTNRNWSSGGDIMCLYDAANGGHWFFTQFVSASRRNVRLAHQREIAATIEEIRVDDPVHRPLMHLGTRLRPVSLRDLRGDGTPQLVLSLRDLREIVAVGRDSVLGAARRAIIAFTLSGNGGPTGADNERKTTASKITAFCGSTRQSDIAYLRRGGR
jgi:hypothetical protein